MNYLLVLTLLLFAPSVLATLGVDISQYTDTFSCIHLEGYDFAIVRGYHSYGRVDLSLVKNLNNAWDGGMKHVDVYLFPCVPCGNPVGQVDSLVNALSGQKYGTI